MHNKCKHCGCRFGGEDELSTCFACFELFEEPGGPQYDPDEHDVQELIEQHYN